MNRKAPETCQSCIFYQPDGDDIGTCTISDNIVEPTQEACNDQISNNYGSKENPHTKQRI